MHGDPIFNPGGQVFSGEILSLLLMTSISSADGKQRGIKIKWIGYMYE